MLHLQWLGAILYFTRIARCLGEKIDFGVFFLHQGGENLFGFERLFQMNLVSYGLCRRLQPACTTFGCGA